MKMIYEFINPQDIPSDLPPGEYTTRVVETGWKDGDFWVSLEYLGEKNCDSNRCLFPLIKINTDDSGNYCIYCGQYGNACACPVDISDDKNWREYAENSIGIES